MNRTFVEPNLFSHCPNFASVHCHPSQRFRFAKPLSAGYSIEVMIIHIMVMCGTSLNKHRKHDAINAENYLKQRETMNREAKVTYIDSITIRSTFEHERQFNRVQLFEQRFKDIRFIAPLLNHQSTGHNMTLPSSKHSNWVVFKNIVASRTYCINCRWTRWRIRFYWMNRMSWRLRITVNRLKKMISFTSCDCLISNIYQNM